MPELCEKYPLYPNKMKITKERASSLGARPFIIFVALARCLMGEWLVPGSQGQVCQPLSS